MDYTLEHLQEMMANNNGNLDLSRKNIMSLPEGLIVEGNLNISNTPITTLPEGLTVKKSLLAYNTNITSLPDTLQVGKSIDLSDTPLVSLPSNLIVNGFLNVENTRLARLPKGLKIRGYFDLSITPITSLPKDLLVGGYLYLDDTPIRSLSKGIKVCKIISNNARLTNPNNYNRWQNGDYKENEYLYADGFLTFIKKKRQVGVYTFYQGRFPNRHIVTDGTVYAHCKTLKEGLHDLAFKHAKHRETEKYKHLQIDDIVSINDAIVMYRIITGACQAGVDEFIASLGKLKEMYTVQEIFTLTEGHYGHESFQDFFCQTA